jgi:hypothetical protein
VERVAALAGPGAHLVDERRKPVLLLALQERVDPVLEIIYIVAIGLEERRLQFFGARHDPKKWINNVLNLIIKQLYYSLKNKNLHYFTMY